MPVTYAMPMKADEIFEHLQNPDNLEQMGYIIKDWVRLVDWMATLGAPVNHPDMGATELVQWMVENVEKSEII